MSAQNTLVIESHNVCLENGSLRSCDLCLSQEVAVSLPTRVVSKSLGLHKAHLSQSA